MEAVLNRCLAVEAGGGGREGGREGGFSSQGLAMVVLGLSNVRYDPGESRWRQEEREGGREGGRGKAGEICNNSDQHNFFLHLFPPLPSSLPPSLPPQPSSPPLPPPPFRKPPGSTSSTSPTSGWAVLI